MPPWAASASTSWCRTRPTSSHRSRGSSFATAVERATGSARGSSAASGITWPRADSPPCSPTGRLAWADRPRRWVEGSGCDAWLLRSETQDALTYAAVWTRGPEEAAYAEALERWRAHYEALGIRSLVMGALVLRRRSAGPGWVRADDLPAAPDRDASAALQRVFAGEDRLRELATNAALLEEVLRVAEPLRLRQTVAFRDGIPEVQEAEISLADGLPLRGGADAGTIRLVQLCDGRRRLREVVAEMARSSGTDRGELTGPTLAVARRLIALGFLEPTER
jgi:hypothetical protein